MKKHLLAITFLTLALHCPAQGDERWGLEKCVEYAVANNLQVKQSEESAELQRLNVEQSKFNYIPTLGASAGYNANFGRSLDQTTYQFINGQTVNNFNAGLQLSTQVFAGMGKLHSLKRSQIDLLASIQQTERIKNDIMLSVTAAYLQILYNKEQITNSENQVNLINDQIERTQKLVDAGSVALGALLDLQSQKAAEEYNTVTYRNQHTISVLTLTQLLELRNVPDFDIEIPSVDGIVATTPSLSVNEIFDLANELPQIRQARLETQSAEHAISLARAKLYPTLNFSASYGSSFSDARQKPILGADGKPSYINYPFFDQFGDNASAAIGLSLNVPIFYGLTAERGVKIAKLQKRQSELSLLQTSDKLYKDISQAWADATSALDRYRSAQSSVKASQEAFRYADSKFSAGASNVVDYNQAKNNLINAQSMMTQAKWEYVFKSKILDFYAGIPIKL
ncbi:MAG: TolC family protein [Mucinivorans sp.]